MGPEAIAQIYASDIISGFDLHKPEVHNVLFRRRGDQGLSTFQLIRSLGFEKSVASDSWKHYEDNHIHEVIHVKADVAAPAAGEPIQFTLAADDLDANNNFYLRENDRIMFPNEVIGHVLDIDVSVPAAPVVTVEPADSAETIPALTEGETLAIITDAWAEGTGQPGGALSGTWEYDNDAQIIKESIGFTGTEMVNQSWVNVTSNGQQLVGYYMKGQIDVDYRIALKIDGAILWEKRTTNTGITGTGVDGRARQVKTTEGLIPYTRRVGNEQTYTSGAFDVDEFNEMDNTLDREFAGNYIMGLLGITLHQNIEDSLKTYFANTNISFARQTTNDALFNKNESLGASVNFTYLTKSERTFLMKRMGSFSNSKVAGATGYNGPKMGLWMPINKSKDPVSGDMVPSIGIRYRALGKYSRRMEVWQVGGAGEGLKVTEFDSRNTYLRCHIGTEFFGGNRFILMEAE